MRVVAPVSGVDDTSDVAQTDISASLRTMHVHEAISMRNSLHASAALAALALLCVVLPAHAAVLRVGSGGGCTHATLQAAIATARVSAEADEIRLSATQITEANLLVDGAGGTLTISGGYSTCLAAEPTTGQRSALLGVGSMPVLRVRDANTLVLENLDIREGNASRGGGLDVQGNPTGTEMDVVVLSNTYVRSNVATRGGGLSVVNTSGTATPANMQVLLFGDSNVLSNNADEGAGIHCTQATVMLFDRSHVGLNTANDGKGGGIFAVDCEVVIGSRGVSGNGAVLWSNTASGTGGGLHIEGASARADLYTVDANVPARVTGNSAIAGGAITATRGARVRLFDAVLEQNRATAYGGAILLSGSSGSGQTTLLMQRAGNGTPLPAVPCAVPEACNLVRANIVLTGAGSLGRAGAAITAFSSTPDVVRADFRGTRFDFNEGSSLAFLGGNHGEMLFSGALMANNIATEGVVVAEGSTRTLEISSSTIANNGIGEGHAVLRSNGACTSQDGTSVRNSIVWQPQRALIAPIGILDGACFRYLLGNDFSGLPAAPDRAVMDPHFLNPAAGNFNVYTGSGAIDFAPARPADATRDGGPRVLDLVDRGNLFGPQDAGAYERYSDRIFDSGFDCKDC